jgi:hypothetical protein
LGECETSGESKKDLFVQVVAGLWGCECWRAEGNGLLGVGLPHVLVGIPEERVKNVENRRAKASDKVDLDSDSLVSQVAGIECEVFFSPSSVRFCFSASRSTSELSICIYVSQFLRLLHCDVRGRRPGWPDPFIDIAISLFTVQFFQFFLMISVPRERPGYHTAARMF